MKDDRVYLAQIVDATNLIRDFVASMAWTAPLS